MRWQRVEKPVFGYAIHVPEGWEERAPNTRNSPFETARFGDPADRRRSVIVFRSSLRPRSTAAETAEEVRATLAESGFTDFAVTDARIGGRAAARLDCAKHDAGRVWQVREYFVMHDGARITLGCGTSVPGEDGPLFDALAERFELVAASE